MSMRSLHFSVTALVDGHTVHYIMSSKGKLQLLIDGHPYFRNKVQGNRQTFVCNQYSTKKLVLKKLSVLFFETITITFSFWMFFLSDVRHEYEKMQKVSKLSSSIWNTIIP